MELVLKIDGKDKTFVPPFISGRMFRKTMEISKKMEKGIYDPIELDKVIDWIVEVYGNQFTRDEFYDGIASKDLNITIIKTINEVTGTANQAMGDPDPNK